MSVLERIFMLKKILKEAEKLVTWQESIFTDLHTHKADASAHHPVHLKTLADHPLGTVVPHDALASLTEKAFSSLTGRWTLAQAHRGALNKIMVFKGPDADPVEEDKPTVPSGLIVMWHGLIANIPTGWVICDGNNGTPDLLAKFVEGVATAATNPGATGGEAIHTLALSEIPAHTHPGVKDSDRYCAPGASVAGNSSTSGLCNNAPGTTGSAGGGGAHQNRPPFYDIAFIMKT